VNLDVNFAMSQPLLLHAPLALTAPGFWAVAVPVVLGAIAVFRLLPRPNPLPVLVGGALGALALVLTGWLLLRTGAIDPDTVLFYLFSAIAVISGGGLVVQRNPVYAALSFALVVLSTCGLFLLQAAPFLTAATVIIYAGAIVVTFLFVIMLAQQAGISNADARSREPGLSCFAAFLLLGAILFVLEHDYDARPPGLLTASFDAQNFDSLLKRVQIANRPDADPKAVLALQSDGTLERLQAAAETARGTPQSQELVLRLRSLREQWEAARQGPQPLDQPFRLKEQLAGVVAAGQALRARRDDQGRAELPAANVAYLGQTLFSEYLLAVELGGTLLLVATIGAIAITGRRAEGLR
jgi:NADH:ubiquinone oxidoreductase subunit 6 (subunit J)